MTMLLRPAKPSDATDILRLAKKAGFGITTLPTDRASTADLIKASTRAFSTKLRAPVDERYLFVLEDLRKKKVVGTSAIDSAVGHNTSFYSYKLSSVTRVSHDLNIQKDYQLLNLVNDYQGKTEIGTLFLDPSYRHSRNGVLLSRSRFLFMANFPKRFSELVFAEMRGVSDSKGISP